MMRETPSPIDLAAPALDLPGLGWATATIASATAILLVANAVSVRDWIDDLPPGPVQAQASLVAGRWVALTEAAAVGQPRHWLHDRWKAAEAARF